MPKPRQPKTLRLGTWNALRDRPDGVVRGDVRALLRDHPVHALAVQEAADYHDVLRSVPGYVHFGYDGRGKEEQAWLVRDDIDATGPHAIDMGGDGWTTVTNHHHPGDFALAVTLAGWLRAVNVHLPPSLDWHAGKPSGPPERVDDYIRAMTRLNSYRRARPDARGRLEHTRQAGHYGSDHPLVLFTVRQVGDHLGLCFVGDWNNKPGRDDGAYSVTWLGQQANMRVGRAAGLNGRLNGVDVPLVARRLTR